LGNYLWGGTLLVENTDFSGGTCGNGFADGFTSNSLSTIYFDCCEIHQENVGGLGEVVFNTDGCSVSQETNTLDRLKSLCRRELAPSRPLPRRDCSVEQPLPAFDITACRWYCSAIRFPVLAG
jgi:hypothetical protein